MQNYRRKCCRAEKVHLKILTEKIISEIFREEVTFKPNLKWEEKERAFQAKGQPVQRHGILNSLWGAVSMDHEYSTEFVEIISQDGAVKVMTEFGFFFLVGKPRKIFSRGMVWSNILLTSIWIVWKSGQDHKRHWISDLEMWQQIRKREPTGETMWGEIGRIWWLAVHRE